MTSKVEVLRRLRDAAERGVQSAQATLQEVSRKLEVAEVEERAANFKPNATMLWDIEAALPLGAHGRDSSNMLAKGERVQAGPRVEAWNDTEVVRSDGTLFKVEEGFIQRD